MNKQTIKLAKLVVEWSDGKTEDLTNVLPEYLREELEVYFDELEDLRQEHDNRILDGQQSRRQNK